MNIIVIIIIIIIIIIIVTLCDNHLHIHLHLNCTIQHCHARIQIACIYCLQQLNKGSLEYVTENMLKASQISKVHTSSL